MSSRIVSARPTAPAQPPVRDGAPRRIGVGPDEAARMRWRCARGTSLRWAGVMRGKLADMVLDGGKLEGAGARIAFVQQQQIDERRDLDVVEIARAIGHGAVGDLEQDADLLDLVRVRHRQTVWRTSQARCAARSMRRPRSMNSQLGPRVMFSAERPDKRRGAAHQRVEIEARAGRVEGRARRRAAPRSSVRAWMVRQVSSDSRSRTDQAVCLDPGQQPLQAARMAPAVEQMLHLADQLRLVARRRLGSSAASLSWLKGQTSLRATSQRRGRHPRPAARRPRAGCARRLSVRSA